MPDQLADLQPVIDAANTTARAVADLRATMVTAMNALVQLHASMRDAGILDTANQEPMLCDGCGRTDRPVTATDDGRALACPDCLPAANDLINNYCPHCSHPWTYHTVGGQPPNCCMPVRPGTSTPAATPNDPTERCGCTATEPATAEPNPITPRPARSDEEATMDDCTD